MRNTLIRLADYGIRGNGHMMMIEKNNQQIAAAIAGWLNQELGGARRNGRQVRR